MLMKRSKEDNRGFSLIELVVVMVIMAMLVGIAGIYIFPYIRKSKEQRDVQKISAYCTDAVNAYASSAEKLDEKKIYTITITKGTPKWSVDATDNDGTEAEILKNEFVGFNQLDTDAPEFESKEGQKISKITIQCKNGTPSAKLTVEGPEDASIFTVEAK